MTRYLLFLLLMSISVFAQVQPDSTSQIDSQSSEPQIQTLLEEPVHHAIHGVARFNFSKFGPAQNVNLLVGGELAWVMNKKYLLGFGVTGLATRVKAPQIFPVEGLVLVSNYGGLLVGYIHNSHRLIHVEGQTLIGVGQAFYREPDYDASYDQDTVFFIVEPGVNAVLNVTSGFRLSIGVSYRMANHVHLLGLENKDISGLSLNVGFKIGRF